MLKYDIIIPDTQIYKENFNYMENFIVDRIEGNIAVCEGADSKIVEVQINRIVGSVKEGDVLTVNNDKYIVNTEETEKRKKHIEELMKGMWE